jgi:cytidylate kinase
MSSSRSPGDLLIAVSSKSGCGNTTVSRLVAERLGLRLVNYTFHDMAMERGVTFEEVCRLAEDDPSLDQTLDRRQVELARAGRCVLASRLAIWLLREEADLTVYLTARPEVRAERIARREGISVEAAFRHTLERDGRDRRRYLRLYGIDVDVYGHAGLVVDTELGNQNYVAERILAHVGRDGFPPGREDSRRDNC